MHDADQNIPLSKLSYSLNSATEVAGVGLTKLYQEIKAGRLKAKKFGKRTLVTAEALQEWLNNLPDYDTKQ